MFYIEFDWHASLRKSKYSYIFWNLFMDNEENGCSKLQDEKLEKIMK